MIWGLGEKSIDRWYADEVSIGDYQFDFTPTHHPAIVKSCFHDLAEASTFIDLL